MTASPAKSSGSTALTIPNGRTTPSTEPSVELQAPETRPVVENPQIIYSVGETAQYVLSEENVNWYWRVVVNVLGADAPEAQPAA